MAERDLNYDYFVRNLKDSEIVKKYVKSRNLSSKIIANELLGYCSPHSRYPFPLLKGRLIVPIRDVDGNTIALAGRQIPGLEETTIQSFWDNFGSEPAKCEDRILKWKKGKWLNEPYQKTRNLFFLDRAKHEALKRNYLILVEGYFDVYSFFDNGYENTCALCGTSISEYQIALASRYCDNIILVMDSDDAGRIASEKIISKVKETSMNIKRVFLPTNMDPDDFAQKYDLSFLDGSIRNLIESKQQDLVVRI
jgi:DNA primase